MSTSAAQTHASLDDKVLSGVHAGVPQNPRPTFPLATFFFFVLGDAQELRICATKHRVSFVKTFQAESRLSKAESRLSKAGIRLSKAGSRLSIAESRSAEAESRQNKHPFYLPYVARRETSNPILLT
jgi:hypothetical protein